MKRYHALIGFPRWFRAPRGRVGLIYTSHAMREARHEEWWVGDCTPSHIHLEECELFEIQVEGDQEVVRLCYRLPAQDGYQLCLAIHPAEWKVITLWTNRVGDRHRTLRRQAYEVPSC